MPSESQAQNRLMHAVAENPKLGAKLNIAPKVARDFVGADKGRKIGKLPQHVKKK